MKVVKFFILLCFYSVFGFFSLVARNRNEILKIYNWADYIDEEVLNSFPEWYKEQTGESVEIVYQTFDLNESMLTEIEIGKEDYDLICPSEYIIERMLRNDLLQPIAKEIIDKDIYYFDNVASYVSAKFQEMAPQGSSIRVSDYTVGYMWGTTGWLYNKKYLTEEDVNTWGLLLQDKIKGRVFVKDAYRDVYSVFVLYGYIDSIKKGVTTREELVKTITPDRMSCVEGILRKAKENIAGWEVDFGKEEMTKGNMWLDLCWSGDAQWAIQEARNSRTGQVLAYCVPKEGSNVWFDGWCIPKYAKNVKAATYFIDYICRSDIAIANMEATGYVSVVATPEVLEHALSDTENEKEYVNLTYFFGPSADNVYVNPVYYPDQTTIDRCALMHDCSDQTENMMKMWTRIKGDNLNTTMIIFIVCFILLLVFLSGLRWKHHRHKKNKSKFLSR